MTPQPYLGITGPVTREEVDALCKEFSDANYKNYSIQNHSTPNPPAPNQPTHLLMLGFLVSYKTLHGQTTTNRRYFSIEQISKLVTGLPPSVLPMIHYNSREMETLAEQVTKIFDEATEAGMYATGLCRALQLNIVWPNAAQVGEIKNKFPAMRLVFQASQKAMEGRTPTEIAEGIRSYGDVFSYVLIDPSGGKGIEFDIQHSLAVYNTVRNKLPDLTVGFAGGFTGDNVTERVEQIAQRIGTKYFCIDAEGGLRDKITPEYGDDVLNLTKARAYIRNAAKGLK